MTGLVLKLKANERFLINGVVLQNGDRPAKIRVRSSDVAILRTRDALRPEEADTPLRKIYYQAQLALAGETDDQRAAEQIIAGLDQLNDIFAGEAGAALTLAREGAANRRFFLVMRAVRRLFAVERALLSAGTKTR